MIFSAVSVRGVSNALREECAARRKCLLPLNLAAQCISRTAVKSSASRGFAWLNEGRACVGRRPPLPLLEVGAQWLGGFSRRPLSSECGNRLAAVKNLREKTGVSLGMCQSALREADWCEERALKILKEKNLLKKSVVDARACRTHQGVVAVSRGTAPSEANPQEQNPKPPFGLAVLSCQTDFVARNAEFIATAKDIAALALLLKTGTPGDLKSAALPPGKIFHAETVEELLRHQSAKFGETLDVTASYTPSFLETSAPNTDEIRVAEVYVHSELAPGVGLVAGVVEAAFSPKSKEDVPRWRQFAGGNKAKLHSLTRLLAMQAVALRPKFLTKEDIPGTVLEREINIIAAAASHAASLPTTDPPTEKQKRQLESIRSAMEKRFFEETVFMEQEFLMLSQLRTIFETPQDWLAATSSVGAVFKEIEELTGIQVRVLNLRIFDANAP